MVRPRQPGLTQNELEVIKILWENSPLTVSELRELLKRKPKPAYTSLLTLMQAMERKGYVSHKVLGKAYAYLPVLKRENFLTIEIKRIAKSLFGGSPGELVLNLVEREQLNKKEIASLKKLLEEK
ncbi:MAG: BlaI/MecI/CopY family transcriptional regulator [Myxococcales bacterium]|nr:BlaI/MecI/CopY family transcriptional regulator [Myxococcales bacterium]USN49808.1 MAG: BlaI/MecI/CopY family transcriptional regulator [Myxococcales bacterium]